MHEIKIKIKTNNGGYNNERFKRNLLGFTDSI